MLLIKSLRILQQQIVRQTLAFAWTQFLRNANILKVPWISFMIEELTLTIWISSKLILTSYRESKQARVTTSSCITDTKISTLSLCLPVQYHKKLIKII